MGKIRSNMEQLANEVRASKSARHAGVKQVRESARGLLGRNRQERKERAGAVLAEATSLGVRLGQQKQARKSSALEMKAGLARTAETRRGTVRQNSSQVRCRLRQAHAERSEIAARVRHSVQQEVGGIRQAVGALKSNVRKVMGEIAADVREARRLWRAGGGRKPQRSR